ncbi:MAG: metalloregulator ArsR/SmtB family transcription factor [bacterium]|nr:metalloregulator ArsR/SmtB family transcription factor [bacterium]
MKNTEKTLKALANLRRLAIVKFLNKSGKASVGGITAEIKLSFKATSKHLRILANADLLDREQVGLIIFYSLSHPINSILKSVLAIL